MNSMNGDTHFWSLSNNFISVLHLEDEVLFIFRMLSSWQLQKINHISAVAVAVSSNTGTLSLRSTYSLEQTLISHPFA